jgi:hypothetical protein
MALERKTEKMPTSQKDQLAAEAIDRWGFKRFGQQQNDTPN